MAKASYPCKGCGVQIAKLKFCNRDCGRRWHDSNTARKNGVVPIAEYRRHIRAAALVTCMECGEGFLRASGRPQSYCSRQCTHAEARRRATSSALPFTPVRFGACVECDKPIVLRNNRIVCSVGCANERAKAGARARTRAGFTPMPLTCAECDRSFSTEYGKPRTRFCSDKCARRASKRTSRPRERARLRLVRVESVDPFRVFDRDGWRCQCCRKPTPKVRRGTYHPRAPELDHIIPLSKGGEHSYCNTQLLCRACNGAKSDTDGGQQMRLFG